RTEVDDLTAIIAGQRLLRPFQQPGPAEQPLLPQLIQLLVEIRQWICHDSPEASRRPHTYSITLPAVPARSSSNASANRSRGNRWVITGVMSRPFRNSAVPCSHVCHTLRPKIPARCAPLKIIPFARSTRTSAAGRPRTDTHPPLRSARNPS